MTCKIKAYNYNPVFAITLKLSIQFMLLSLYMFTYSSKLKKVAISMTKIGGLIIKSETCIGTDLILFGKLVFIIKDSNFLIFKNETGGSLAEAIDDFIKQIANTG